LLTLYAAGLRLSEATNLKLPDIDSERMQLRIIQAKGHKDRYVPLSPRLLGELRTYWKPARLEDTGDQRRPSWRELFYGPGHPAWFET
jgi:integrase